MLNTKIWLSVPQRFFSHAAKLAHHMGHASVGVPHVFAMTYFDDDSQAAKKLASTLRYHFDANADKIAANLDLTRPAAALSAAHLLLGDHLWKTGKQIDKPFDLELKAFVKFTEDRAKEHIAKNKRERIHYTGKVGTRTLLGNLLQCEGMLDGMLRDITSSASLWMRLGLSGHYAPKKLFVGNEVCIE